MRVRSPVVLSYLDADFEPRWGRKDFLIACCLLLLLLLLAKMCCSPLDPKKGCKTSTGETQLGNKTQTRTEPVLVLRNTLEINVEETVLALQMCLHG